MGRRILISEIFQLSVWNQILSQQLQHGQERHQVHRQGGCICSGQNILLINAYKTIFTATIMCARANHFCYLVRITKFRSLLKTLSNGSEKSTEDIIYSKYFGWPCVPVKGYTCTKYPKSQFSWQNPEFIQKAP